MAYLTVLLSRYRIQEDHPIMSFTLNESGRLALLNVATQVGTQHSFRLVHSFPLTTSNLLIKFYSLFLKYWWELEVWFFSEKNGRKEQSLYLYNGSFRLTLNGTGTRINWLAWYHVDVFTLQLKLYLYLFLCFGIRSVPLPFPVQVPFRFCLNDP